MSVEHPDHLLALTEALRLVSASDIWARRPHCDRDERLSSLFTPSDLKRLLRDVRVPVGMFRVVRDSVPLPHKPFAVSVRSDGRPVFDALDPVSTLQALGSGATLLLASIHEYWPALRDVCAALTESVGLTCEAFAVVSAADSAGFEPHLDPNDQLVVQCSGTKHWQVFAPVVTAGASGDPVGLHEDDAPVFAGTLAPGNVLYLPRGCPHRAASGPELSIHVTFVLRRRTADSLLDDAWRSAVEHERDATDSLAPYWHEDPSRILAVVRQTKSDVLDRLDAAIVRRVERHPGFC